MKRRTFISILGATGVSLALPAIAASRVDPAFVKDNRHMDIGPCQDCGARAFEQHHADCPRGSTLPREGGAPESYWCSCGKVEYFRQPEGHYAATHFDGQRMNYGLHRQHIHLHRRMVEDERFFDGVRRRIIEACEKGFVISGFTVMPPEWVENSRGAGCTMRLVKLHVSGQPDLSFYHPA